MRNLVAIIRDYSSQTRALEQEPNVTEASFYPAISELVSKTLRELDLPFRIRINPTEKTGMPDFVLGDESDSGFVSVIGEVKRASISIEKIAESVEGNNQIGRYLQETGVVIVSNTRGFGLLVCKDGAERGMPVPPEMRILERQVDLWDVSALGHNDVEALRQATRDFADIISQAVTNHAMIASPSDLAKVLARQARDAKSAIGDLRVVKSLIDDYRLALGMDFDVETERGSEFFKSSLIQSIFYSLFAAWVLWDRDADEGAEFSIEDTLTFLPIGFLKALLHDIRHPVRLKGLNLETHLARVVKTLNRVDRESVRAQLRVAIPDGATATSAITYFYEPFLEAFDPDLRRALGVWYTPPEIVAYQVRRVNEILKDELGCTRGLADPGVVVLDPCCGTGAYLLEVGKCIERELRERGENAMIGPELAQAFSDRVIGFEILAAPFAISQLQIYMMLAEFGTVPDRRLSVYLTNALTGWNESDSPKLQFLELAEEYDSSRRVKLESKIIVVLGNPPYGRFAEAAQSEEAELIAHYKGVKLTERRKKRRAGEKRGAVVLDKFGVPEMVPVGESRLHSEYGIKKQLLDDLYVRFVRLAEQRIGEVSSRGVVSLITNSSYLTGRSHPIMRESLLESFDKVWIDNMNGDRFKTGQKIPKGLPYAGTRDESVFRTVLNSAGIQPGTAISTFVKVPGNTAKKERGVVKYRDFWGLADDKRKALLNGVDTPGDVLYESIVPTRSTRWRLSPVESSGGYEDWAAIDDLFPKRVQGVNHNRGMSGGVVDTSRSRLIDRISRYLGAGSFDEARKIAPGLARARAGYDDPEKAWTSIVADGGFDEDKVRPILTFPMDRWHVYHELKHKLLNRPRPKLFRNLAENEFLIAVPEPRKASESLPVYSTILCNLHVHERGSVAIPRDIRTEGMFEEGVANLPETAWRVFRNHFGLTGELAGQDAKDLVSRLFRIVFAMSYSNAYQRDHASALSRDWAQIPIPRDTDVFARAVDAGSDVACLLDTETDASEIYARALPGDLAASLGAVRRVPHSLDAAPDFKVSQVVWRQSESDLVEGVSNSAVISEESVAAGLGDALGDVFVNRETCFSNVPKSVWEFQLGGYPVLRKWLGYRQSEKRSGRPLSTDEARWFREIVLRLSAILSLRGRLDEIYAEAAQDCFVAEELRLGS